MSSTEEHRRRVRALFEAALAEPVSARSAWLEAACADDEALRRELLELLCSDAEGFPALDEALAATSSLAARVAGARLPTVAGFELRAELGSGGMGAVFRAEQHHPRREVALKVLSPLLLGTAEAKRRFEHEARLLARLAHEGIASIYQAGYCDDPPGAPYYAMELVEGASILAHAAARELDLRSRVDLLARVADAVQHAHQRGILHRDLKPSNLLVTAAGQPKILDFGIARDLERGAEATSLTSAGQVLGTLGYMSPEQANGDGEVDTRSDVYALGVVLYELVAGRPPIDLRGKSFAEAARALDEQEPPALGTLEPAARGDLETIARKALAKEPARRYESAAALAADLRRFLDEEPIAARPPSTIYLLRKFARRRRALVAALLAAALALVAGAAVSLVFALRATRAAEDANAAAGLAREEAARADRERERAQQEARTSERFVTFLFEALRGLDPARSGNAEPTLREAMDALARRVEEDLEEEVWLRARLHGLLGTLYDASGAPRIALEQLERACALFDAEDDRRPPAMEARMRLATGYLREGRYEAAEARAQNVLELLEPAGTALSPTRANALLTMGEVLLRQERATEALPYLEQSLELRRDLCGTRDDEELAVGMLVLAQALATLDRLAEAEELSAASLAMRRRLYAEPHLLIAESLQEHGHLAWLRGNDAAAAELLGEAVRQREQSLPPGHPAHTNGLISLSTLAEVRRDYAKALELIERAAASLRSHFGDEHPEIGSLSLRRARILLRLQRPLEAEPAAREALQRIERAVASGAPASDLFHAHELLGAALQLSQRPEEADAELREALALLRREPAREPVLEARLLRRLIVVAEQLGRSSAEEEAALRALESPAGG